MLVFLCVPRSMVWNEEEAKNPIYLRILKPKNIPTTWKHILLQLKEENVNSKIPRYREVQGQPATAGSAWQSQPGHKNAAWVAFPRPLWHGCARVLGHIVSPLSPCSSVSVNNPLDFQRRRYPGLKCYASCFSLVFLFFSLFLIMD